MLLLKNNRQEIRTNKHPQQFLAAIENEMDVGALFNPFLYLNGEKGFLGSISGSKFVIRKRIPYRNSFARCLYGTVHFDDRGGCLVTYRLALPMSVKIFMTIWLAGVGFGAISMIASAILHPEIVKGSAVGGIFVPPLMLLAGVLMLWLGPKFGRKDEEEMRQMVQRIAQES